jgi:hypothetical protein
MKKLILSIAGFAAFNSYGQNISGINIKQYEIDGVNRINNIAYSYDKIGNIIYENKPIYDRFGMFIHYDTVSKPICDSFGYVIEEYFHKNYPGKDINIRIYFNVDKSGKISDVSVLTNILNDWYISSHFDSLKDFLSKINFISGTYKQQPINMLCYVDVDITSGRKIKKSENYFNNRYTFMLNSDFRFLFSKSDKLITGYTFCYKITRTNSLIFMHLNGITPSIDMRDIRSEKQRGFVANAIGISYDLGGEQEFHSEIMGGRFYGLIGYISAIPESDVLKKRNTYLYSNIGVIWDMSYVSCKMGIGFAPMQATIGLGVNIGSVKK